VIDVSEQLDECIYPKTEEVLHASRDDEVFDAVFLVEFQPDDNGNIPINLYAISEALGLQVTGHELEEDDRDYIALTVRGPVKGIRALSSELHHPPDVLKRLMPALSASGRGRRSHSSRLTVFHRRHESA
jgi:hypothetical protein